MGVKRAILFVLLVAVVLAAWAAWQLWPVQIMVLAYRFTHPIAASHQVYWADGPPRPPAGERPPNILLIVADDLGINDITAEGGDTGVAGGLVATPNIDAIARAGADFTVVSAETARDSVVLEAGAKYAIGNMWDLGVYYNGRFNEDYDANAVTGRLGIKF